MSVSPTRVRQNVGGHRPPGQCERTMWPLLLIAVLLPMLLAAAFLLGRHLNRQQFAGEHLSLVTRHKCRAYDRCAESPVNGAGRHVGSRVLCVLCRLL